MPTIIDNTFLNLVTLGDGSDIAQRIFNDSVFGTLRARGDNPQVLQGLTWSVFGAPRSSKGDVFGTFEFDSNSNTGPSASWSYSLSFAERNTLAALDFDFIPAKPDTVTLGAGEELTLTSKTPGASAEAGDDIPQIRARLVIDNDNAAQPSIVIDPPNSASGSDEVDITITVAAGTTWRQVSNFINTGNLLGGSGSSAAAEYVTAEVRVPSERVESEDSTGAGLKFDRALLADGNGINQIVLTARRPGDGDFSSTDPIPEITFTLTKNAGATGFIFDANGNDGTLDITYNAGATQTWAQIVGAINKSVASPNSRQASNYISAALVGANDGSSIAEPIAEVELTGALGVPDESVVSPFKFKDNFNKSGDLAIIFSSLLEPGDDRDIKVTLQRDSGRTDSVSVVSVTESNSEINITIVHGDGVSWIQLTKDVEAHSVASKYVVASLPYTSDSQTVAAQLIHGTLDINIFAGFQGEQDQPQTAPLTDGMRATVDNSMPVFETLTGGADEVPPGDLTFTYTIRAEETGGTTHDQDVTIVFSAENNAPDLHHLGTTENVVENVVMEGAGITASDMLEFRDPNHFEDKNADLIIVASLTEDDLTGDEAPTIGRIGDASVTYTGVYGDFTLTRNNLTDGTPGQIGWTYAVNEGRADSLHKYREENGEAVAGTFGTDTLYVRVWDDERDSSEIRAVEVEVRGVNDVPTVTTSSIAVNRGDTDSITLTDENINFTDLDASEDPANIKYTIKTAAPGARITRNDVPLSAGGTFTHQNILDGWVTLDVSNANLLSGLKLTVTDGTDANPAEVSLNVQARGVPSIVRPDDAANSVDHSGSGGNLVIDTGDYGDQIKAAQGSDFITGGLGDDTINLDPRAGNETGQDTVVYNFGSGSIFTATDGGDDITGFKRGEDIFLLKTESDNPELATLDGLLSYVGGPNKISSHDDVLIVTPNYEYVSDGSGGHIFFLTGITLHFEDAGIYGNGYLAKGRVSITFDERLDWADFLSLIEIDNGDGTVRENFNYGRGIIRDLSVLPNLMGEGSLAYEREGAVFPIEIAPSGVRSVEEAPSGKVTARTDITYFVLDGVATGDLRLAGPDAGMFDLDGNVLYLQSGESLDYDSGVRTLNVRVHDARDSAVGVDVKVKVENVNDVAPVFVTGELLPEKHVVEFDPDTEVVYDAAAAFDRTRIVWSLKEEDDHELFDIDIDTGEVRFKGTNRPADDTIYNFTVVATSGALAPVEQEVTIYPTDYTAPVIADTTGSIQDGDANSDTNTPDAVSGAFMVTSGLDIEWESAVKPGTTRYGTLSFTDDNRWEFELNAAGIREINSLNAGETTQAIFNVTATNIVDSDEATLTIDLQGYSPTGAPVFRNDDVDVTVVVDGDASGQIGFTGDDNGTAFAADIITPIGRHSTGSYRAVANADGSTNIEGTYGILTLNHDGSWTYALDHADTDTIALSSMRLPVNPRTNREQPIEMTETFSLGYRSVDGGNAVDEVANIDITVTNSGAINTTNNFTNGVAFGFLPASGQVGARRGNMFLDFDSFTLGIGNTRQRAIDNLDNRIAGDDVRQVVEIRLILNFNNDTQMTHEDPEDPGVLQREQIYGIFCFDFRDGSWTYTITEPQAGRDSEAREIIDNNNSGRHDHGDNLAIPVYIAVQDITGARLPTLADGSPNADISSISLRGADVIKVGGSGRAQGTNKNEFLQGRPSVTDDINTGEGYNGVFAGGGADNITLGNGLTFHPDSIAVLDPQVDVVYHRVHFDDGDVVVERPWRNTNNVDGNDIINNFIRNEDQFIFVEWTRTRTAEQPNHEGVKLSEEQFLSNNALVLLTATIEQSNDDADVFTLVGFKIGFARNGSDSITFNYHNKSKVALTTDEGSLTTDDILTKYGLASTDSGGKHVIANNQQITGTEVRHNYFGDTNEDSFQILHALPTAITEI